MSLCLASAGVVKTLSIAAFTLMWTHSIEKVDWQEDWRITPEGLELVQARVKGSGAGMEPPPDAMLADGVWHYRPADPWRREIVLARSDVVADWQLCLDRRCRPLSHWIPVSAGATTLSACSGPR